MESENEIHSKFLLSPVSPIIAFASNKAYYAKKKRQKLHLLKQKCGQSYWITRILWLYLPFNQKNLYTLFSFG